MISQEKEIKKIEEAMRTWINKQLPTYKNLPPALQVTSTAGETVLKANPALQEIRNTFKDYVYIVKIINELSHEETIDVSSIDDLRKKFKVV